MAQRLRDTTPALLKAAKARNGAQSAVRPRISFVNCDIRDWPGSGDPFDAVLIYDRFDQRALAERVVTDFASHVYFPAELEPLFVSAGFKIVQQYGGYRFVPQDRTSQYVVTVARRPRPSARRPFRRVRHNASPCPVNGL